MAALGMKAQYGPTLGQLLSPRWQAARPLTRWAVIAVAAGLVAVVVGAALTLENATYSHGGRLPFSFSYRGLYRVASGPGEYVKLEKRAPDGRIEDSFAVDPLQLPPYSGRLSGELPLYAAGYIQSLSARYADFQLRAEGRTDFGRAVLYMPERTGAREGVVITMLTLTPPRYPLNQPPEVASTGLLARPLRSFSFG